MDFTSGLLIGDIKSKMREGNYQFWGSGLQNVLENPDDMRNLTSILNKTDREFYNKFEIFPHFSLFAQLDRLDELYKRLTPENKFDMTITRYEDLKEYFTYFEYHFYRAMAETRAELLRKDKNFSYRPKELKSLIDQYSQKVEFRISD